MTKQSLTTPTPSGSIRKILGHIWGAAGPIFENNDCDCEKAIADYTEAIRLDPKNAKAYSTLGDVHSVRGDHDKAIADYSQAIRLDPENSETYTKRGGAYLMKDDCDKAIADYTDAIRLDPKNQKAHAQRTAGLILGRTIMTGRLRTSPTPFGSTEVAQSAFRNTWGKNGASGKGRP